MGPPQAILKRSTSVEKKAETEMLCETSDGVAVDSSMYFTGECLPQVMQDQLPSSTEKDSLTSSLEDTADITDKSDDTENTSNTTTEIKNTSDATPYEEVTTITSDKPETEQLTSEGQAGLDNTTNTEVEGRETHTQKEPSTECEEVIGDSGVCTRSRTHFCC